MKIYSITPTQQNFCAKNSKIALKNPSKLIYDGLTTAGAWFAFGVGLDFVSRKCHFSKSPTKNSLALNGIIAGVAGLFTVWQVSHQKSSEE